MNLTKLDEIVMSRCIGFVSLLLFHLCFTISLLAETSAWEVGLRTGVGRRVPGRFDGNLNSFSSTFNPLIFSDLNLNGGKQTNTYEAFIRFFLDPRNKVGAIIGRQDLSNLYLTETTSDSYYTSLKSEIFSYHVLVTYHYVTEISRNWEWENGGGFGFASADWQINGYNVGADSVNTLSMQKGNLRGSGLAFRLETAVNRRLGDSHFLQIGLGYHLTSIAKFSGPYNGEESSFYIQQDGKVGVFDDTRVVDVSVGTNQSLRRLDMNSGSWNLYFSVMHRFLD